MTKRTQKGLAYTILNIGYKITLELSIAKTNVPLKKLRYFGWQ